MKKALLFSICLLFLASCGLFRSSEKKTGKPSKKTSKKELVGKTETEAISTSEFIKTYSAKLDIKLTGKENQKLIKVSASWLGTPYKYGGCDRKGTDCSCLVRNIYKEVYGIDPGRSSIDMYNNLQKINSNDIKEGDIVVFAISSKQPDHVGIYIKDGKFIHASTVKGVMVSSLEEPYFKKYFHSAVRLKK